MNFRFSERFSSIEPPNSRSELLSIVKNICNYEGIEHVSYFSDQSQDSKVGQLINTTHSDTWLNRYSDNRYDLIDPVIRVGFQQFLPIDWLEIPKASPTIKSFFGEAAEFGVFTTGLTIPIRDERNGRALFSVNTSMSSADWANFKTRRIADLSYLAFLFHEKMRLFAAPGSFKSPPTHLSNREEEVLRWASEGKTAWETSVILGLSNKTVDFYLRNVCAKLNVANKTQAVARAITLGLIRI